MKQYGYCIGFLPPLQTKRQLGSGFSIFEKKTFSRQDLVDDIFDQCTKDGPHKNISATENGVRRDVDCFIRSYLGTTNPKALSEDKLDSPFTELGLFKKGTGDTIQKVGTERKIYRLDY